MDVNAILAAMNAEGYNVKDVTADDLSTHLAALTEARDNLAANVKAGTVTADADVLEATRATVDAIAALEAEMAERAAVDAQVQADLAAMLGLDAAASEDVTVEETVDATVDEVVEPVAAGFKPFSFPAAPIVERTPTPDASVTASAQPAIRYYEHKDGEIDSQTPYTDKGLAASWKSALSVNVGSGKRRIAIERTDIAHAVRASDYAANDQSGSIFVDAHTKWKETRADRLMANRTGLSAGKLAVQASCVAPARPVLDIGTPCEVTAFTDDMPTIVTTEKIDVYPRPEVDYSVMQDGVFVVTESAHYAGYESEGGPTPDKECAKICPGEPISCEPIATGYCAERDTFTETFWPSALAASETILGNAAKLARDAIALERLFDPTNANPTYIKKPDPITVSDFGVALDMLGWINDFRSAIKACTGCDFDSLLIPEFVLRSAVLDHQKRFGTRIGEAAREVMAAFGAEDGMTIRTYSHAPATWLLSGGAATLTDGSPLSPKCVGTGVPLSDATPARAAIFAGFTDGLSIVRHAEIEMSVQKPTVNKTQYLNEQIATTCITRSTWAVDVPVCVKGAVGAMASVACPA